jgi:hypothetical protein
MRIALTALAASAAVLVGATAGAAKEFNPGDLRICSAKRCVPIVNRQALTALGAFYYIGTEPPARVRRPKLGAASFELRFDNGYVTGIVATPMRDRFLSYGVNIGRFETGRWYRVPRTAARELRTLTARLAPIRLTSAALARSR